MFDVIITGKHQSIKTQQEEVVQEIEAHLAQLRFFIRFKLRKSLFICQYVFFLH